jgi:hypothetical protein
MDYSQKKEWGPGESWVGGWWNTNAERWYGAKDCVTRLVKGGIGETFRNDFVEAWTCPRPVDEKLNRNETHEERNYGGRWTCPGWMDSRLSRFFAYCFSGVE